MKKRNNGIYAKFIKRLLDIICSLSSLIILSPVIIITAILVRVKLGSPVLFTQDRPGLNGEIFKLYKFRSMTDARDGDGNLLPDEDRLSEFGKRLRSTSLDELPELFNIIKGDMSIVGPRPLLVSYLPWYTEEENRRHDVRPGLTGLAQVSGRNFVSWEERFAKDVEYVNHLSFMMDIRIIIRTFAILFDRNNVAINTNAVEGNFAKIRENAERENNR